MYTHKIHNKIKFRPLTKPYIILSYLEPPTNSKKQKPPQYYYYYLQTYNYIHTSYVQKCICT